MFELLVHVVQLRVLQLDAALQNVDVPFQPDLLLQQLLLLLVISQLNLRHVLLVFPNEARAILAAQVVVPGHPYVLRRQNANVTLVHGHSVSQRVQIVLEFRDHLFGKIGTVGADLFKVVLLFGAGDVEGGQGVEERVDFGEERFGDVGNPTQGIDELFFALDLVVLNGFLVH